MWIGGVRVIVFDDKNRILMVRHDHKERTVWLIPGGGINEGENSRLAAVREVKEETGLDIEIGNLIWHIEEVGGKGQRFVDIFMAQAMSFEPVLGTDPELAEDEQVLSDVKFMSREEIGGIENLYPELLKEEFWIKLEAGELNYDAFKVRCT